MGLIWLASPKSYRFWTDSVMFERDMASHSNDILGKVKGCTNKVIEILMHYGSVAVAIGFT